MKGGRLNLVEYDVTGNTEFSFERSVLEVTVFSEVASSTTDSFEINLSGEAGIGLSVISGKAGFSGIVMDSGGFKETGSFDGTATFDLLSIMSLDLGEFDYRSEDSPFDVDVPDGFDLSQDDLAGSDPSMQTISVTDYLCFGNCENSSDTSALNLRIGGDSDSESATFQGGIGQVLFYRKADGTTAFKMQDFSFELGDSFEATAGVRYNSTTGLMAAGSVDIDFGGTDVAAMFVGNIGRRDGDLTFGFFTAVSAGTGFEVVPGILSVSGFGGGFFYRPDTQIINDVVDAANDFRPPPPGDLERESSGRPTDNSNFDEEVDFKFAVMLYAELDLIGVGGSSIVSGSTFIEITNLSFAIDADGHILGMDGSTLTAGGIFFAGVSRAGDFTMNVSLQTIMEFSPIIDAGAGAQFMLTESGAGIEWALKGWFYVDLLGIMDSNDNLLLASNDGFLIEAGFGTGFSAGPISITASVTGSLWYLTYDGVEIPLGAYAIFNGEASLVILSGEATFKAAFVRRGSGDYEFFGYGEACAGLGPFGKCTDGWFRVRTHPSVNLTGSRGEPGPDANTVQKAQDQAQEFEDMITETLDSIESELAMVSAPGVEFTDQDLAQAGYNLRRASDTQKAIWKWAMLMNEVRAGNTPHQVLEDGYAFGNASTLRDEDEAAPGFNLTGLRDDADLRGSESLDWIAARNTAEGNMEMLETLGENTIERLQNAVVQAVEYESEAQDLRDELISKMASSPVTITGNVDQPLVPGSIPQFSIDETKAQEQSMSMDELTEVFDELDDQVVEVVNIIEENLEEMDNLLSAIHFEGVMPGGFPLTLQIPSVNSVSQGFAETLTEVDRYFALQANRYWHRINVSMIIHLIHGGDRYDGAVHYMLQNLIDAHENRFDDPDTFDDERHMIAERVRLIQDLMESATSADTPYNFSDYPDAQEVFDDFEPGVDINGYINDPDYFGYYFRINDDNEWEAWSTIGGVYTVENLGPSGEIDDFDPVEQNIRNLWVDIHRLGSEKYVDTKVEFLLNEYRDEHMDYRESVTDLMEVNSALIDDFYDLKSNMLSNLYHIVDNYVQIREIAEDEHGADFSEDENFLEFKTKREEILSSLEAPDLSSITVETQKKEHHYFGKADIHWDATHPAGIADISLLVEDHPAGSMPQAPTGQHISIGKPDYFTYYSYFQSGVEVDEGNISLGTDTDDNTRHVELDLRVRSEGGILTRQNVGFSMAVGPDGQSTQSGANITQGKTSAPEEVMVDLSPYYPVAEYLGGGYTFGPMGFEPVVPNQEAYFTIDEETINIMALVREPETSIGEYRYFVGSTYGDDNIVEESLLIGEVEQNPDEPGDFTEKIEAQTQIINLQPDQPYFVSVLAYNINEQMNGVNHARPVIYDDTPPTKPEPVIDLPPFDPPEYMGGGLIFLPPGGDEPDTGPVNPYSQNFPDYSLDIIEQTGLIYINDYTPSLGTMNWKASEDDISGVSHYELYVSEDSEPADFMFDQEAATTDDPGMEISSGENGISEFSFEDELYVHVRAVNHADLKSDAMTAGPGVPFDPSPPDTPEMEIIRFGMQQRAYITRRSYTPTVPMLGHQYAIGTSPGEDDIRPWPEDDDVDYANTGMIHPGDYTHAPFFPIFDFEIPEGEEHYISIRGINVLGETSEVVTKGPFVIDNEPPEEPVVSLTGHTSGEITVDIENITDAVSGVRMVEVRLEDQSGSSNEVLEQWHEVAYYEEPHTGTAELSLDYDPGVGSGNLPDVVVKVRITNSSMLSTTVSESIPPLGNIGPPFNFNPVIF